MRTIINTQRLLLQFYEKENALLTRLVLDPPKHEYGYFDDPRWQWIMESSKEESDKLISEIRKDYGLE